MKIMGGNWRPIIVAMIVTLLAATVISAIILMRSVASDTDSMQHVALKSINGEQLYGKRIVIVSSSRSLRSSIENVRAYGATIASYAPDVLLKGKLDIIKQADVVVLDETALNAISGERDIVEQLLRSGKPLILIAKRPLRLLLSNYTPENAPLAIVPVEVNSGTDVYFSNKNSERGMVKIGIGHDIYAMVIITRPIPMSDKLAASYIVYREYIEPVTIIKDLFSGGILNDTFRGEKTMFANIIDSLYTWEGLGSYRERSSLTSYTTGETVGEQSLWLHFSYALDYNDITHPELGLWRIEVVHHYIDITANSLQLQCYLPGELGGYWSGRPNEIIMDVSQYDDQDIADMWPFSETTGPTSLSISFIPESPYIAPTLTLSIDNDITILPYRKYEYSSYYGYDRVYMAGWKWGEDLPSITRRSDGRIGAVAYVTAIKEIPEYGTLQGVYIKITSVGSIICDNVARGITENPTVVTSYEFYISPLTVQLLNKTK